MAERFDISKTIFCVAGKYDFDAVCKQIERCVMVTRPQPGLDRDIELLKHINAERDTFLSIGALVASPGMVHIGDGVQHLPADK